MQSTSNLYQLLDVLQVWFDYRTLVEDQTDVGFDIYALCNYYLPVEALTGLLIGCRNACAAWVLMKRKLLLCFLHHICMWSF